MLVINCEIEELEAKLEAFVWDFKIGDNIRYNLGVVYRLGEAHNAGGRFGKPISVLAVSVIEALIVDFVTRLQQATNHFPDDPDIAAQQDDIKAYLDKQAKDFIKVYEGEEYKYRRLRNFGYSDLVEICEHFKIFGDDEARYKFLESIGKYRNRVHIKNYFENFEKDESRVFTERRVQEILDFMCWAFEYFEGRYARPW